MIIIPCYVRTNYTADRILKNPTLYIACQTNEINEICKIKKVHIADCAIIIYVRLRLWAFLYITIPKNDKPLQRYIREIFLKSLLHQTPICVQQFNQRRWSKSITMTQRVIRVICNFISFILSCTSSYWNINGFVSAFGDRNGRLGIRIRHLYGITAGRSRDVVIGIFYINPCWQTALGFCNEFFAMKSLKTCIVKVI